MSTVDEILAAVPLDEVAQELGVDRATAEQASRAAIPTLLAGLEANAADPGGAASLANALGQHADRLPAGAGLAQIDTADGEAIVRNIFGSNTSAVVSTLADAPAAGALGGGALGKLLPKLLPILAPIVLSWLAKRYGGGAGGSLISVLQSILAGSTGSGGTTGGGGSSGGGLGDILGDILGGGSGGASTGSAPRTETGGSAAGSGVDSGPLAGPTPAPKPTGSGSAPAAKEEADGGSGFPDLGAILGGLFGGGKR